MGNKCICVSTQSTDEAEDALLDSNQQQPPRGPPPPYQPRQVPVYVLTEEQKLQLVTRLTLIQSLPVGRYLECGKGVEKKSEKSEKRECPICMNDFVSGEPIRLLPCMHYYHLRCADDWLLRSPTCPTCMQHVDATTSSSLPQWRSRSRNNSSSSSSSSSSPSSYGYPDYSRCSSPYSPSCTHTPSPPPPLQHTTVEVHHH